MLFAPEANINSFRIEVACLSLEDVGELSKGLMYFMGCLLQVQNASEVVYSQKMSCCSVPLIQRFSVKFRMPPSVLVTILKEKEECKCQSAFATTGHSGSIYLKLQVFSRYFFYFYTLNFRPPRNHDRLGSDQFELQTRRYVLHSPVGQSVIDIFISWYNSL